MARKQREKDPRPRPQPPRTSQARHVAGVVVGPGSVAPGPLELSLSRDCSRTLHRSGSRRLRIAGEHGVVWYDTYCTRGRAETVSCAVNGNRENERTIAMARKQRACRARPVFHVLWVLAGIDTVNLSRATSFVIVLFPAIFQRHVLIPALNEII